MKQTLEQAADKIYVLPEVASVVKVLDEEVEYIRKDALLEWLKEQIDEINKYTESNILWGAKEGYQKVIYKLNSM